ncbi:MAG TPA: cytochrome c nitrite reductase small subunit [Kiritimatiellia bacterium]|nr:cytochrome c nitrite reductase small subunit [Kiritimatiellia bacterium]
MLSLLHKLWSWALPPPQWRVPVLLVTGVFCGLGLYAARVSNFTSYLSDDPATCVNCHIMAPHYATWSHSSHREHATCNDCHVPQDNIIRHYASKARDGSRHAAVFTLRMEPDIVKMNETARKIVQENCVRCHDYTNERVSAIQVTAHSARMGEGKLCFDCHRDVPHGTVRSAASAPFARVPLPDSPVPQWLQDRLNP